MKKILAALCIVAATSFAAKAQKATFGVKGGLNISSLSNPPSGFSSRAGFYAGGLVNVKLKRKWAIQPELVFSSQGYKYDYNVGIIGVNGKGILNYINIPVMVQYSFLPEFYVEAGPQLGFLVAANAKGNGRKVDIRDQYATADFGLGIGAGYKFPIGLGISARYNFGLSNIYDKEARDNSRQNSKNSVGQIGVFYLFK